MEWTKFQLKLHNTLVCFLSEKDNQIVYMREREQKKKISRMKMSVDVSFQNHTIDRILILIHVELFAHWKQCAWMCKSYYIYSQTSIDVCLYIYKESWLTTRPSKCSRREFWPFWLRIEWKTKNIQNVNMKNHKKNAFNFAMIFVILHNFAPKQFDDTFNLN